MNLVMLMDDFTTFKKKNKTLLGLYIKLLMWQIW